MKSDKLTTVHVPIHEKRLPPFVPLFRLIKNSIVSRELIYQLFKRDFFGLYKKSLLGASWILISPILAIVSWLLMNYTGVLQPGDVGIPYPAYVLLSSSIWGLFRNFFDAGAQTLLAGKSFINQVNYCHEVVIVKNLFHQTALFFLSFIINIIVLILFGVFPKWQTVFTPFALIPLFLFGGGLGIIFSVFMCISEDIKKITDILLTIAMFITPVIYSSKPGSPLLEKIVRWNPLTYLIGLPRDLIVYGGINNWVNFFYSLALAFLIFIIGLRFFYSAEAKVIEKII